MNRQFRKALDFKDSICNTHACVPSQLHNYTNGACYFQLILSLTQNITACCIVIKIIYKAILLLLFCLTSHMLVIGSG